MPWEWGWHGVSQGAAQLLPFPCYWHLCLCALGFSSKGFLASWTMVWYPPILIQEYSLDPHNLIFHSPSSADILSMQYDNPSSFPARQNLFGEGTRPWESLEMDDPGAWGEPQHNHWSRQIRNDKKAEWPWFLSPTHWEYSWIWNNQPLMRESWIPTKNLFKKKHRHHNKSEILGLCTSASLEGKDSNEELTTTKQENTSIQLIHSFLVLNSERTWNSTWTVALAWIASAAIPDDHLRMFQ